MKPNMIISMGSYIFLLNKKGIATLSINYKQKILIPLKEFIS